MKTNTVAERPAAPADAEPAYLAVHEKPEAGDGFDDCLVETLRWEGV